jgi:hypothetical protein
MAFVRSNSYAETIASCSPLSKSLFGGKNGDKAKISEGFVRMVFIVPTR